MCENKTGTFCAGFGRGDITPDYPVYLQGGPWKNRRTTGILDRVYATCVALRQNGETVLLYTLDMKLATDNYIDPAKAAVSAATGIPEEKILFNATHTHSSVAIRYEWDGVEGYRAEFNAATIAAAREAMADLSEAEVYGGGIQTEGLVFVRHYLMNDGTYAGSNFGSVKSGYRGHAHDADRELQVAKLARAGKKDIVLLSFPSHGTFNEHDTLISADFPAGARETIEASGEYLVAYFMGASGDQVPSSRIPGEAIADYREHGNKLGEYALRALPTLSKLETEGMSLTTLTYTAPTNKLGMEKLEEAKIVRQLINDCGSLSQEVKDAVKKYGFSSRIHANWIVIRSALDDTKSMDLRVLTVGGLAFVLAPYEMFGLHGLEIKEKSPFKTTFIITCSEGSFNYIPTVEAFDYGCYEGQCSYFARGTGDKLVEEFLRILQDHKERKH